MMIMMMMEATNWIARMKTIISLIQRKHQQVILRETPRRIRE